MLTELALQIYKKCEHTLHIQSVRSSSVGWYKAVLTTPILYIRCVLPNARELLGGLAGHADCGGTVLVHDLDHADGVHVDLGAVRELFVQG